MKTIHRSAVSALVLLALCVAACNPTSAIQRAVNLVPMAISTVSALEAAWPSSSSGLERVKQGLQAFQKVGSDYLVQPSSTGLAAVISAAGVFVADFDTILPGLPPQYKAIATAADVALHLIQMVVGSATTKPPPGVVLGKMKTAPAHVDQTALRELAKREGLEKYVK